MASGSLPETNPTYETNHGQEEGRVGRQDEEFAKNLLRWVRLKAQGRE